MVKGRKRDSLYSNVHFDYIFPHTICSQYAYKGEENITAIFAVCIYLGHIIQYINTNIQVIYF